MLKLISLVLVLSTLVTASPLSSDSTTSSSTGTSFTTSSKTSTTSTSTTTPTTTSTTSPTPTPLKVTPAYSGISPAQQALNLNAAISALIIQKILNDLVKNQPSKVVTPTYSSGGSTNVQYNCVNSGQFAMTFDDGPFNYGQQIQSVFTPSNSKATFFVNGNNYQCIYDKADDLIARYKAGHQIASHTWGHDDITKISSDDLNKQITLVETALWKILGIRPHHFRPPYGAYNDAAIAVLAARGYQTVIWSDDDGDSTGSSVEQSLSKYEAIYKTYPAPHNVLNHETYSNTANYIIPVVVPKLLAAGWKLVTLATCLNQPAYQTPINYGGTPGVRDSSWTCANTPAPGGV